MTNAKRISDLTSYTSILPYDSELYGVYQSLIGWKSKRQANRMKDAYEQESFALLSRLAPYFELRERIDFNADFFIEDVVLGPASFSRPRVVQQDQSILLEKIGEALSSYGKPVDDIGDWDHLIGYDALKKLLNDVVLPYYRDLSIERGRKVHQLEPTAGESDESFRQRQLAYGSQIQSEIRKLIETDAQYAGVIQALIENKRSDELRKIFYVNSDKDVEQAFKDALATTNSSYEDPYLTFDPNKDVKDVSLSPLGIVHLFRQYFFELDTFLGTPTSHVWLSPGASVELIETSSRKITTEKIVETSLETDQKTESSSTDQDDISEAVKQDNKNDMKLGITTTAKQSWGTGSVTATGSLNMDQTQQVAREDTHKKMRQQTQKLSTEIRQNYKSTFRTVTEVTDTSSKRYLLSNTSKNLINYELRRKMRQIGVQVQDVGTYLCWETFVDDPGEQLGLANLIHIAQPAELVSVPDHTRIPYPEDQLVSLKVNASWNFGESRKRGFVMLTPLDLPFAPEGLELRREPEGTIIPAYQVSGAGTDFTGIWAFGVRFAEKGELQLGVIAGDGGIEWDKQISFVVNVVLTYTASNATKANIDLLNQQKNTAAAAATEENLRKTKEALLKDSKERLEIVRGLSKRSFEDLREEERIIVYRNLLRSLMSDFQYGHADDRSRHVLSELINSIFDIDKMLYFVAPEWWKPRIEQPSLFTLRTRLNNQIISWSRGDHRPDNYWITEKTAPAPMGSSLGWLLQLDGDNLRNAFLNAPWVKAVIPIRPGKEQAALQWLQSVNVEGSEGLDDHYTASDEELDSIRVKLGMDPAETVTIRNAIDSLCKDVAEKNKESTQRKTYPETETNPDDKVTTTPVQKVYEHGFYPLQGGFRFDPNDPDKDPNNKDKNFAVFDQWIEVLPTDQVVPVEVAYDPKTGRQL
ncbi:peptidoglycan-binding protein [Cohnella sp. AR92]|uniref:peptidoglycan-binding protein n=1 Tax=Cohnella sp. AR92 TaxID=648716 RepID=UPI000F8D9BB1|nr:peptidoglycan-binding protein [Cohnella sp. AR92]RUS43323.1 peptidoglycan-binding protein [Cohnella sp. AR92]